VEKRQLGRTAQMSSVVAFGGAALWKCTQGEADRAIELAIKHGVNHFDVAPSYGEAEVRLRPWMEKHKKEIFLGCKTQERSKKGAWESIKRSLERLRVDHFDLFQLHAVDDIETLKVHSFDKLRTSQYDTFDCAQVQALRIGCHVVNLLATNLRIRFVRGG